MLFLSPFPSNSRAIWWRQTNKESQWEFASAPGSDFHIVDQSQANKNQGWWQVMIFFLTFKLSSDAESRGFKWGFGQWERDLIYISE